MREDIKINKMGTFMRVHGQRIFSMQKERSFTKEMEIFLKVSLCMEVNSDKVSIILMMDEYMRDTFTMVIAMVWVN